MNTPRSLSPDKLRTRLDPALIPFDGSKNMPELEREPMQPRALAALRLALAIPGSEYNVFLAGEEQTGRTHFIREYLRPLAAKSPTPDDVVYVHNFEDPDRPRALTLPAGRGRKFRHDLAQAASNLRHEIPASFEQEAYLKKRELLQRRFQAVREDVYTKMEQEAARRGFSLSFDEHGGMTIVPLVEGKLMSHAEFERLPLPEQKRLRKRQETILTSMNDYLREIDQAERTLSREERDLDRETTQHVLAEYLGPLRRTFADLKPVDAWLADMETDVVDSLDEFAPKEMPSGHGQGPPEPPPHADDVFFRRYEANLFVDNSRLKGAPIVSEDNPTFFNLLGCIERESEYGAFYTDSTLLKAGALHRANHGYLVIHADELLHNAVAYEGLLRALRAGVAKIEDPTDQVDSVRTKTVEPEPVALSVKVVLVGIDELYELLLQTDRRFRKLFKVKAHMQDHVERTDEAAVSLAAELCRIIRQDALPEFDREALAWLVDHSSRLAADQTRLSLEYPLLREIMIEAAALARLNGRKTVGTATLHEARDAQIYRANLFEEEFMADYDREIIKVPTRGEGVGVVNGMSVTFYGDYVFGLPHRIACTVGVGRRGIIDLEREAELGGPIHTKAIMILTSFLLGRFAHDKPLILSGTIHFEQSYAGIEGDSASGAELACLLSALADVPINLSYAFTGAVGHQGDILAVGDVTRKIEGFFKVCKRRGLTGGQGVLLPKDNVDNLMLSAEVIDAVDAGRFHVFPVETIEQAMEILTRHPAGEQHPDGSFTEGSIFARVDARFRELGRLAHAHGVGTSPPQHD